MSDTAPAPLARGPTSLSQILDMFFQVIPAVLGILFESLAKSKPLFLELLLLAVSAPTHVTAKSHANSVLPQIPTPLTLQPHPTLVPLPPQPPRQPWAAHLLPRRSVEGHREEGLPCLRSLSSQPSLLPQQIMPTSLFGEAETLGRAILLTHTTHAG